MNRNRFLHEGDDEEVTFIPIKKAFNPKRQERDEEPRTKNKRDKRRENRKAYLPDEWQ